MPITYSGICTTKNKQSCELDRYESSKPRIFLKKIHSDPSFIDIYKACRKNYPYFNPFEVFDHFEAYFHLGFTGLP